MHETLGDKNVYVYGYETPRNANTSNIPEIANSFVQQLRDDQFFAKYDQVFFVTHSMGGLITKRMLTILNTPDEITLLQHVRAVVFIAVPGRGARVAVVASWLSRNPQFKNMRPEDASDFLHATEESWETLLRARNQQRPFPRSFVAYETKEVGVFKLRFLKIVPELYTSTYSDLTPRAFNYDHREIVKPDSVEHEVYKWTKARILDSSRYGDTSPDGIQPQAPTEIKT